MILRRWRFREAETLGERRGWSRLVAACLAERVSLLLERGRLKEAAISVDYLGQVPLPIPTMSDQDGL